MNPAAIVWACSGVLGLLVVIAVSYFAGLADGAESVRREAQRDPREEVTGIQCRSCLKAMEICVCPMGKRQGRA